MTRDELIAAVAFRALQDAWLEGERGYWERRAARFEAARPKPDDYHGQATHDELTARYRRLTETARACRNRGTFTDASRANFTETLADIANHGRNAA